MRTKMSPKLQLMPILFRMEIGLPFMLFAFPLNLIIALFFAITNYLAENAYCNVIKLFSKFGILVKTCLVHAILLAIGWAIHCKFTYVENGEKVIDVDKIYAVTLLVILIPLLMIICRCICCYIDKLREN